MTTEPQDVEAALNAIEQDVEFRRADPDVLMPVSYTHLTLPTTPYV